MNVATTADATTVTIGKNMVTSMTVMTMAAGGMTAEAEATVTMTTTMAREMVKAMGMVRISISYL
jgi:hypothetical protein